MSDERKPDPITVRDLCARLKAEPPAAIAGHVLHGVSTLSDADEKHVSYVQKEKYVEAARTTKAGLILAPTTARIERDNVIYLKDVMDGVLTLLEYFHPDPAPIEYRAESAVVADTARFGSNVYIGPHVVVGENVIIGDGVRIEAFCFIGDDCSIGEGTRLMPRVTILHATEIGRSVLIHSGAVIGADGFRFEKTRGRLCKVPQVGRVIVEDDVEIGANSTIDRASLTETRIGARTKIDNLVHIGHNVIVGPDCVIVAQVGIAGSVKLGRGVMLGGAASLKDHITLGEGSKIAGRSAVQHDVPPGAEMMGNPAIPLKEFVRFAYFYKNFGEQWAKVKALMKEKSKSDSDQ